MSKPMTPPKLATDLPQPRVFTEADFRRFDEQAAKGRAAVEASARAMESLTAEDLRIRLR